MKSRRGAGVWVGPGTGVQVDHDACIALAHDRAQIDDRCVSAARGCWAGYECPSDLRH